MRDLELRLPFSERGKNLYIEMQKTFHFVEIELYKIQFRIQMVILYFSLKSKEIWVFGRKFRKKIMIRRKFISYMKVLLEISSCWEIIIFISNRWHETSTPQCFWDSVIVVSEFFLFKRILHILQCFKNEIEFHKVYTIQLILNMFAWW